ncbi:S1 family peptidase [Amycolatopsis sp. CA-126428]|uniref:S1 family peptidase n=1 Tax=Amycolatopsis sp. CA-126428 TaxID=2073158 RepID=UPI0011B066D4|nr:trypsin-like serine protease [Amycolatopsis sp. CA-126428]
MRLRATAAAALALLPMLFGISAATADTGTPPPSPSTSTASPRIVGGDPAPVAYAGAGSLQLLDHDAPNWHSCGLTLLEQGYDETGQPAAVAATASHCLSNPPSPAEQARMTPAEKKVFTSFRTDLRNPTIDRSDPAIYHARFGSPNRLQGGVVRVGSKIVVPAGWAWGKVDKDGKVRDVSLIRFVGHVDGVRPARVAPAWLWQPARAIGWGISTDPAAWTGPAPAQLSQLDVPLLRAGKCAPGGIGAGELCAGVPPTGGGVCNGDSGSGLLQRHGGDWYLLGAASRTIAEFCGSAAIYTDLNTYRWWIIQEIRQLLPGALGVFTHTAPATPVG